MENKEKVCIFCDDIRNPYGMTMNYMYHRIGNKASIYNDRKWIIVRDYDEFVKAVDEHLGNIEIISFDHDLAAIHYESTTATESFEYDEKTGLDCAKYFLERNGFHEPCQIYVHSMNVHGAEKIKNLFIDAKRSGEVRK